MSPSFWSRHIPSTFYQPFSEKDYDLCFTCHDKQLVTLQKTTGLTGFRNGDQNLHFVHVNRADRRQNLPRATKRTASPQPLHVRKSVPYGNWQMPINFRKTDTGGSCAAGCHKALAYDRVNPVPDGAAVRATERPFVSCDHPTGWYSQCHGETTMNTLVRHSFSPRSHGLPLRRSLLRKM